MKIKTGIVLAAFVLGCAAGSSLAIAQSFLTVDNDVVGKEAPSFTLKTLSGEAVSLSKTRAGKKTILFFWATWCPHCRAALNAISQDPEQFERKGIKFILVNLGETREIVQRYAEKNNVKFPVFLDESSALVDSYGLGGVPTFFFIDEKGIVQAVRYSLPENYEEILSKGGQK